MAQPSATTRPRRSSLAYTSSSSSSSSSKPKPVKQVRFSFPVTILEAPDCPSTPASPALSPISCEDGATSKRRRLAHLLLLDGGSNTSIPLSPTRSGIHVGEGRCLTQRGSHSTGSRLMWAMKSPNIMAFGREGSGNSLGVDGEGEEGARALAGNERGVGRIDEEEDDDMDVRESYHSWHMRWLETDEDAD